MNTSLDETEAWQQTAFHESGHAIVARYYGFQVQEITVRRDGGGETRYAMPPNWSHHSRACTAIAGGMAVARKYGGDWRDHMSDGDRANFESAVEQAGVGRYERTFRDSVAETTDAILTGQWQEVETVVRFLAESGGPIRLNPGERLLYETVKPRATIHETAARPQEAPPDAMRLARRAAEIWAADGPVETASFRRLHESTATINARLIAESAAHDVSGQPRNSSGEFAKGAGGKAPSPDEARRIQRETYTPLKHPEEGHIDMRRLAIHPHSAGLEMVDTYKNEVHATPVESEEHGRKMLKARVAELLQQGWRHTDESRQKHPELADKTDSAFRLANKPSHVKAKFDNHANTSQRKLLDGMDALPGQKDLFNSAAVHEAASSDTGWITIGAHRGEGGEKHGGTPVKISGGKIVSGPPALAGKTLRGLSKTKPHLELRRAISKAHKEHGFDKRDIEDAIEFVHGERKRLHDERETAKEHARKLTGLSAGDISRLSNSGHDYASGAKAGGLTGEKLRHFDQFAQEAAREHPELGLGDADSGDDFSSGLWDVLGEGKREAPAKHHADTVDEAVRLLHQNAKYKPTDDEVPF